MAYMSYFMTDKKATFASAFKELRLRAGISTLRILFGLLADSGFVIEESTLSRWQGGTRIPKNRELVLELIKIFVERFALTTVNEANYFLRLAGLVALSELEERKLPLRTSRLLVTASTSPLDSGSSHDFSGVWNSRFGWVNSLEPQGNISEYDVIIYQNGNQLVMQSVPNELGNYFVARLSLNDEFLNGTWQEQAQPQGEYSGQIYNGVGMLKIDKSGNMMCGKIVEYNNDMEIVSGDWKIVRSHQV
jgi:hypothetical protein